MLLCRHVKLNSWLLQQQFVKVSGLRNVLSQISADFIGRVVLYIDNRSTNDLVKNPVFHGRSKHIDIRYHFIRECVERGEIVVKHISSDKQCAYCLTKALAKVKFEKM